MHSCAQLSSSFDQSHFWLADFIPNKLYLFSPGNKVQRHDILGHSKNLSQCINNSYAVSGKYLSLLVELLEIVSTLLRDTITFQDGKLRVLVEIQVYNMSKALNACVDIMWTTNIILNEKVSFIMVSLHLFSLEWLLWNQMDNLLSALFFSSSQLPQRYLQAQATPEDATTQRSPTVWMAATVTSSMG